MTAIFSTIVTQAQRDACDYDLHGRAISQTSRQNTQRPGWHAPDGYVEPTNMRKQRLTTQQQVTALKEKLAQPITRKVVLKKIGSVIKLTLEGGSK